MHDDYRVLRLLKPRPADPAYQPVPGESIALVINVETTGLEHISLELKAVEAYACKNSMFLC